MEGSPGSGLILTCLLSGSGTLSSSDRRPFCAWGRRLRATTYRWPLSQCESGVGMNPSRCFFYHINKLSSTTWSVVVPCSALVGCHNLRTRLEAPLASAILTCPLQMSTYRGLINVAICRHRTEGKLAFSRGRCGDIPTALIPALEMSTVFPAKARRIDGTRCDGQRERPGRLRKRRGHCDFQSLTVTDRPGDPGQDQLLLGVLVLSVRKTRNKMWPPTSSWF